MFEPKTLCVCGSGASYESCCEPCHDGREASPTALALMRSRYSAFVHGKLDYLVQSTLPERRSTNLKDYCQAISQSVRWLGLEILDVSRGGPADKTGFVEFKVSYVDAGRIRTYCERSRFRRKGGRWYYVDNVKMEQTG